MNKHYNAYLIILLWSLTIPCIYAQSEVIYDDALTATWQDWSWGGAYDFAFKDGPKEGQNAIEALYTDGFGGLQLRADEAYFAEDISAIRFWVKGTGVFDIQIATTPTDDGEVTGSYQFKTSADWVQQTITMDQLGNPGTVKRLFLQNFTGNANIRVYYDQIELLINDAPPTTTNTYIQVDQFGYLPNATKVAVLADPKGGFNGREAYHPGIELEIRNAGSDAVVYKGSPTDWNNGEMHNQSGDKGWWFDFSNVTMEGEYYVYDPENDGRSAVFEISPTVYDDVLKASGRMFYYNRCNTPKVSSFVPQAFTDGTSFENDLQDGNCRYVNDRENANLEKDLRGGWFDAGDYNKYVTFAHSPMHDLLWAYEENPNVFGDDWNIPESGNGIADVLDELKWELDWLLKMTNGDGSVHIKMGSIEFGENAAAPPSNNFDRRYYGPTCSSASIANASIFAHAAKVFEGIPAFSSYAAILRQNAINCWSYARPFLNNNTLETTCDDGTIKAGDADWSVAKQKEEALTAAIHLFDITSEGSYQQYIQAHLQDAEQINVPFWGPYKLPLNDALLLYATLPNRDESTANAILTAAEVEAANNFNGYFGFGNNDLYRAYMPDWSYHWGSNQAKASYGIINLQMKKYNVAPGQSTDYQTKADEQLHYFHGVNPLGLVYLSNMYALGGDRCINEIYHTWFNDGTDWDHALNSVYGPPPGFLVGGPNKDFSVSSLSPPFGEPMQKAYLDFNDGFPNNSWELSEPAIYYQAAYIRLLANFASGSDMVSSTTHPAEASLNDDLHLFPNPNNGTFSLKLNQVAIGKAEILVMDVNGKHLYHQVLNPSSPQTIAIELPAAAWSSGVYLVQMVIGGKVFSKSLVLTK